MIEIVRKRGRVGDTLRRGRRDVEQLEIPPGAVPLHLHPPVIPQALRGLVRARQRIRIALRVRHLGQQPAGLPGDARMEDAHHRIHRRHLGAE